MIFLGPLLSPEAETLAIGSLLVESKKSRMELLDAAYNRPSTQKTRSASFFFFFWGGGGVDHVSYHVWM